LSGEMADAARGGRHQAPAPCPPSSR
jgi:hypothetical protein